MSHLTLNARNRAESYIRSCRRSDGTWGPNGPPTIRITNTASACYCLTRGGDIVSSDAGLKFLQNIVSEELPPMPRLAAWPLIAFSACEEPPRQTIEELLTRLTHWCIPGQGWGHATPSYANSLGRPDRASPAIFPTAIAVWAIMAHTRSGISVRHAYESAQQAVAWMLETNETPSGGFGWRPGEPENPTATALALLAVRWAEIDTARIERLQAATKYLRRIVLSSKHKRIDVELNSGRTLSSDYKFFTPAWILLALSIFDAAKNVDLVVKLCRDLLALQDPTSGGTKLTNEEPSEIWSTFNLYTAFEELERQLGNDRILDLLLGRDEIRITLHSVDKPRVYLSHGKAVGTVESLQRLLSALDVSYIRTAEEAALGRVISEKIEDNMRSCQGGLFLFTADQSVGLIDSPLSQAYTEGRPNVVEEFGRATSLWGRESCVIIKEQGVVLPSNLQGIEYIEFPKGHVEVAFPRIIMELRTLNLLQNISI